MLRSFLIQNASGKRAIVTEYDMPAIDAGDWSLVRELGVAKDPVQQIAAVHQEVSTPGPAVSSLFQPDVALGLAMPKQTSPTTTTTLLPLGLLAAAAFFIFKKAG